MHVLKKTRIFRLRRVFFSSSISVAVRRRCGCLNHCFGKFPAVPRKLFIALVLFRFAIFLLNFFCSLCFLSRFLGSPSRVVFVTRINRRALRICRRQHAFRWSRRMRSPMTIRMFRRRTANCSTIMNTIRNMAKVFGQFNANYACVCVGVCNCTFLATGISREKRCHGSIIIEI